MNNWESKRPVRKVPNSVGRSPAPPQGGGAGPPLLTWGLPSSQEHRWKRDKEELRRRTWQAPPQLGHQGYSHADRRSPRNNAMKTTLCPSGLSPPNTPPQLNQEKNIRQIPVEGHSTISDQYAPPPPDCPSHKNQEKSKRLSQARRAWGDVRTEAWHPGWGPGTEKGKR